MSLKHVIKHTENEIIFKCYMIDSAGGTIDISLQNDMTTSTQEYTTPDSVPNEIDGHYASYTGSRVQISSIWWGMKVGKQLDISRIIDPSGPTLHGHYYLVNAGFYDYPDFSDRTYGNKDLRLTFDGPGHCIIQLRKEGWATKIEPASFGSYDNPNAVGS